MGTAYDHVLVTGGTGGVGAEILIRVLEQLRPSRVSLLLRGLHDGDAHSRGATLAYHLSRRRPGLDLTPLVSVRGDITREDLGLASSVRDALAASLDTIVHSAADTRLGQSRESAQRTNCRGTAAVLDFASRCAGLTRLVHLSTAYVSGDRMGQIREDELDCGQGFLNPYERSKFDAETDVRDRMADLPITIVRPSIVVGDSRDGRAFATSAILPVLRHVASGRLRDFPGWGSTRLDLVPVDYVADAVCHLLRAPEARAGTFHVTAGWERSITARRLFELTIQHVGRYPERRLHFSGRDVPAKSTRRARRFDNLGCYLDYLSCEKSFDDSRFRELAGTGFRTCPAVETYLPRVLKAAFLRRGMRRADTSEAPYSASPSAASAVR